MGRIKELKPFVKVFFILIAVFFLSMTLVYCIPTSWIQGNVEKSLEVMEGEGEYPMYFFYRHSAIIDVHTDKLMYESLIQNRDYYNPIQAAMSINQYPRYWHGYQVLLRPLTVVFQVQELRYLGMLTFHLLFFWSAWLMAKKTKPLYAMFYVLTVASGYVVFLPVCFQFLTTFLVLFVSLIVLLRRYDKNKPLPAVKWMLYFFVVGMVENFFDFLTYPILTLGIPLVLLLWLRVRDEQADFRSNFWFMFKASLTWFFGYALTWISKWLLSAAILGVRYFWRTMSVVQYRLEGSEEEPLDRIGTIERNIKAWLNVQDGGVISSSKIIILLLLVAVVLIFWRKLKDWKTVGAYLPILFVVLYPYIWYLVMSNHSQIHYWYTYRAQLVALFAGLVFLAAILRERKPEEKAEGEH
ncbi:hypothetical protein B5F29_01360 [Lachnoclostridium sp. An196]|uniref:hypothetical protein n=1 Tax=Lachnoclostridium sp. An196 TaxID=1965583 RepID=UPI000B39618B|nr:hypothetical protein [Lachnoclostridium sp. An196]OUP22418.1 hypothetical protein B5F29_01360 [Lachnoclostridium sp. An196]